ncbi:hypothetical protein B7463_g2652, partial [Scytalidium lignicola]
MDIPQTPQPVTPTLNVPQVITLSTVGSIGKKERTLEIENIIEKIIHGPDPEDARQAYQTIKEELIQITTSMPPTLSPNSLNSPKEAMELFGFTIDNTSLFENISNDQPVPTYLLENLARIKTLTSVDYY